MAISFNSTVVARVASGLYGSQIGYATTQEALASANASGGLGALVNALYVRDFGTRSTADVAALLVNNVGIRGAGVTDAVSIVKAALDGAAPAARGQVVIDLLNQFATLTANPVYGAAATAFNAQVANAVIYGQTSGTADVLVTALIPVFNVAAGTALGADVMRLTGNTDVRIDFTNPANQIVGLDLDGDGTVEFDGRERSITGRAANFEIVDAYSRNPLNHNDTANNFLGDIYYDGTAFDGDGVSTDGNIFLGGLGVDRAFGGVGNDFLTGGGIAQGRFGTDYLSGGRNADFFFAEFSGLDATDGSSLEIDGGNTADNNSAGNGQSSQDSDWLLFEASDDDEPVRIWLNDDNDGPVNPSDGIDDSKGRALSRSGESMVLDDVENIDASGNLYGLLDGVNVEIGGRAVDTRDVAGASNYGMGSSAQLNINGSDVRNIIIGGFDNDFIAGEDGNDLLMGGNLNHLKNPNLVRIINNGRDELVGGDGDDDIVFETDGGIYEGGTRYEDDDSGIDTLWLTREAFGSKAAADVTTDGRVRIDLAVGKEGGLDNAAGYGGADKAAATGLFTSDQTMYKAGFARTQVQDMENVIATGLGAVDYLAAGTNNPELTFKNQQNHFAFVGDLDLRGTAGANILYAVGGTDVLEGRQGNDSLSGGDANDDFYFQLVGESGEDSGAGDGVDVIHRQSDANGDNLWDVDADGNNTYERDFNIGGSNTFGPSKLTVDLGTTDLASADVAMTSFTIKIGGVTFSVTDTAALIAATNAAQVAALVNTAYNAQDARVTAVAVGNTIIVTDAGTATAAGRDISDTVAEGYAVGGVVSNGAFSAQATFNAAGTVTTKDRLIYKAYEDRLDNEGVDDDSFLGSTISLGVDNYAEDLVINFADEDGDGKATTRLAEDQQYSLKFLNLTTRDKVTVEVNSVKYSLQVGVDIDGNIIAAEDGVGDSQVNIQSAFLQRLSDFINSFMDDDTSAGAVNSNFNGPDTLFLTQRAYNGEETVFMVLPTVTLQNLSAGEPAKVTISNVSSHEVELLDFDGRNGELNATNVLFIGREGVDFSRATLETAKTAGGQTIVGKEAIVVDVGPNNLQDAVFGTITVANPLGTVIPNNLTTNAPLSGVANGFAIHGDDFLLGGAGIDNLRGGTGDDRVEGSVGSPTAIAVGATTGELADGGKNFYAVQVLGEPQARVYILNKWEAANPSATGNPLAGLTLSSVTLIDQTESGTFLTSGVFDDTLQFSQKNFTSGATRFTVTLDDFAISGGVVQLKNDGAGIVGVDADGNGVIDSWTRFTNFENIRTVSGTGNAVAGDGQGNDTLDVTALSAITTGAGGISYNLTNNFLGANGGDPGSVKYSANAIIGAVPPDSPFPTASDYESLVIKVDGVESVIASTGADLLIIDETEAAKNNTFTAGLGVDRIDYQNSFASESISGIAEPTVTIKLDATAASLGGVDTVTMTGGRVGTTVATDTLGGVEYITLSNRTAAGRTEADVLDVTALTGGAIVSYVDGTVKDLSGTTHVILQGIDEIENIFGNGGNDTVIVADASVMSGNQREDTANGTAPANVALATFLDFDTLTLPGTTNTRLAFAAQDARQIGAPGVVDGNDARFSDDIEVTVNQNQFKFDLSKTGGGADSDTVDYSNAVDNISVVVELDAAKPNQFVLVDGDGSTFYGAGAGDLTSSTDRIDQLISVERIVAAQGESVLDLSASTKSLEVKFNSALLADRVAATATTNAFDVSTVRISDLSTASPLSRSYVEYRDAPDVDVVGLANRPTATWSRVEGSDNAEVVILNSAHSLDVSNTFNLRGGANQVKYNELTRSITTTLLLQDFSAADPLGVVASGYVPPLYASGNPNALTQQKGTVMAVTQFQDGNGAALPGGGTHVVTSYTANNAIDPKNVDADLLNNSSLRLAASQDAEDTLEIAGVGSKVFLLSESGTTDNQITVRLGSGSAQNSVILTGYEVLRDASSDDVFDLGSLSTTLLGLILTDTAADHDTIKVGNDGINFNGSGANTIDLDNISATVGGFNFDFDILDVTKVTTSGLILRGGTNAAPVEADPDEVADNTDEVVLGSLSKVANIADFEAVVLTQDTVAAGTSFTWNATAGTLTQGSTTVSITNTVNSLSFGGTVLEGTNRNGTVADVTSGITINIIGAGILGFNQVFGGAGADTIIGGGASDIIYGNGGNDIMDGGTSSEVRTIQLDGILDAGANSITITLDGIAFVLNEVAVLVDIDPDAGDNLDIIAGSGSDAVGAALASLVTANLDEINATAAFGGTDLISVTYSATTDLLTFTFTSGVDVLVTDTIAVTETDGGTFAASVENATTQGSDGGVDTFVFSSTAAGNGADVINNFVADNLSSDDLLDFTAFLGTQTPTAAAVSFTATGLNLLGALNVGVAFNKGSLAAADISLTAAAGKVAVEDNSKAVVLVSADVDGVSDASNQSYLVYFVQDTNSAVGGAGNQTYTVTLVGTINSITEIDAADFFTGTDAFV